MNWLTLTRWEWFKLRGRRVTWALLLLIVVFSSLVVFIRFGDYQFVKDRDVVDEVLFVPQAPETSFEVELNCTAYLAGERPTSMPSPFTLDDIDHEATQRLCRLEVAAFEDRLDRLVNAFTLPGAVSTELRWTMLIAIPILAFFTVLVVGSEYSWGTLRSALMRGTGRVRLLLAKLALIALVMAVTWVAVLVTIIASSAVATAFSSGVSHGTWNAGVTGDVLRDLGRAWLSGLPYVALAALLSILFSQFASGLLAAAAVSLGYFLVDLFSIGRLINLFDGVAAFRWFSSLAEFDLGWNSAAWMFGRDGEPIPGFALASAIGTADYPGDVQAFLVLLVYLALFLGAALWLFRRRDVAGPSG